jgi:acetyl esterase/lipase
MGAVLGIDRQVLAGLLATIPAIGLPKRQVPGDWRAIRDGDAMSAIIDGRFWPSPEVSWTDGTVHRQDGGAVPIRVYRRGGSGSRAIVVYVHGGGLISGNLDVYNRRCSAYVQATGIPMVSVGYGLAPEHPFPRAHDDILTVVHDIHSNAEGWGVDRHRIGIAGDSAGGGLAAGVALRLRDDAGPQTARLACQLLVYPMLDDRNLSPAPDDPAMHSRWISWSYSANATGWGAYLGTAPKEGASPYAVPARAADLAGLPPSFVSVGTLDIFRDEDEAYVERLRAAGVPVEFRLIDAVPHGFDVIAPKAAVTRREWDARFAFLTRHLEWI